MVYYQAIFTLSFLLLYLFYFLFLPRMPGNSLLVEVSQYWKKICVPDVASNTRCLNSAVTHAQQAARNNTAISQLAQQVSQHRSTQKPMVGRLH